MSNPFVHVELNTNDVGKAKAFYGKLFDWKLEDVPMGPSGTYTVIQPGQGTGGGILKHPSPGAQSAWRWRNESQDQATDNELYLFGTWKPRGQSGWRGVSRSGASLFAAHFLTVKVTADPDRIRKTVAGIDFAKLAATLR